MESKTAHTLSCRIILYEPFDILSGGVGNIKEVSQIHTCSLTYLDVHAFSHSHGLGRLKYAATEGRIALKVSHTHNVTKEPLLSLWLHNKLLLRGIIKILKQSSFL